MIHNPWPITHDTWWHIIFHITATCRWNTVAGSKTLVCYLNMVQLMSWWPCGVCGRGVGSNSIQCTSCHKWVHKKCSGIKGSMYKVMRSCICRSCSNPVISTGHTSVDIGASANLEAVDKFCYLGDMLNVDRDADEAVEARIQIGWNKFRQLVPLLINRDISLITRGRLYSSCVRSSMLHGSESWPVRKENEVAVQRVEMRMVRWMCNVKVKDRVPRS